MRPSVIFVVLLVACGEHVTAQPAAETARDRIDPSALRYVTFPWPRASLRAESIAVGCGHACVLDHGVVQCWGRNEFGALGDGTQVDHAAAAPVIGLPPVVEIASGCAHVCGRTESGEVWCWGGADLGEIGDGNRAGHRTTPVHVSDVVGARALTASGIGTCAVVDDAGHAQCWGTFDTHAGAPIAGDDTRPRALATTLTDAPHLVAESPSRSCVVARDATVSCWGSRESVGLSVAPIDPATTMSGIVSAHDLAGGAFLTCASDPQGVACWGSGIMAFGLGSSAPLPPTRIAGLPASAELAVGDDFVCGTVGGETRCAGYGELVDATGRVHPLGATAERVPSLSGLHGIVASNASMCGLDRRRAVHCVAWLSGHEGEPPVPPS